jgi:energy-coupling factor transporter ATP-binding protein EcfA2
MTVTGAYGVRLSGLEAGKWLGVSAASHWPELSCTKDSRPYAPELSLDLRALELRVRADIAHSELVHPLLGRAGSHVALAHGANAMHAGAVAGSAGAWVVIGPKGAGKSTLLASLNEIGVPIVTDDVLVLAGGVVMAGPRCIDLRPDARRFGLGVAVRPSDPRNRIPLPPIAGEHDLTGVIHLEWSSSETTIEPLDHREAIRRLLILRSDKGYPRSPHAPLHFAMLPTVLLKRPRSMRGLDASVAYVERLVSQVRTATPSVASAHATVGRPWLRSDPPATRAL